MQISFLPKLSGLSLSLGFSVLPRLSLLPGLRTSPGLCMLPELPRLLCLVLVLSMTVLSASNISLALNGDEEDDEFSYNYAALTGKCQVYDPFESFNRKIYFVNGVLDTFILRPIAKGYGRFTNDYTKERVGSFVYNIEEPLSTVNYALQGKKDGVFKSFWRFIINSTLGIGGMFDVASKFGVTAEQQRFSNTLAQYGVGPGPYIVLPVFGGSGMREVTDTLVANNFMNPLKYQLHDSFKTGVTTAKAIHSRNLIMPFTDYVTKNSPDSYIAIRDAILQQRESKMDYPSGFHCPSGR